MEKLLDNDCVLNSMSPLTLAFIGDGVYDLLVREYLVKQANRPVGKLNSLKVDIVNCKSQAESAKMILPFLSEEEVSVYKRGRNAQTNSASKHSTLSDYHSATGLEALFGYLYLKNDAERIKELFMMIINDSGM